jgi:hypothetical protein
MNPLRNALTDYVIRSNRWTSILEGHEQVREMIPLAGEIITNGSEEQQKELFGTSFQSMEQGEKNDIIAFYTQWKDVLILKTEFEDAFADVKNNTGYASKEQINKLIEMAKTERERIEKMMPEKSSGPSSVKTRFSETKDVFSPSKWTWGGVQNFFTGYSRRLDYNVTQDSVKKMENLAGVNLLEAPSFNEFIKSAVMTHQKLVRDKANSVLENREFRPGEGKLSWADIQVNHQMLRNGLIFASDALLEADSWSAEDIEKLKEFRINIDENQKDATKTSMAYLSRKYFDDAVDKVNVSLWGSDKGVAIKALIDKEVKALSDLAISA